MLLDKENSRRQQKSEIFKTSDIYFEVDQRIEQHFKDQNLKPVVFNPEDTAGLIERIKKEMPTAVFLNPMSNMYDMKMTGINEILEALADPKGWKPSKKSAY